MVEQGTAMKAFWLAKLDGKEPLSVLVEVYYRDR